jgi:hypothetical protein
MGRVIRRMVAMVGRVIDRVSQAEARREPLEYGVLDRVDAERLLRERQARWRLLC